MDLINASWKLILGAMLCLLPLLSPASTIKSDEEVLLFPTSAYREQSHWIIPIHGWIFEPEQDSLWRHPLVQTLSAYFGKSALESSLFQARIRWFLVDNERGKTLQVRIDDALYTLQSSAANGHFRGTVELENALQGDLSIEILAPQDPRRFQGRVQLVGTTGISVISDIDDTIKISHVLDQKELLTNTFLRPFRAVPGMSNAYQRWSEAGAVFHYVSSSPWQLYPALSRFMEEQGFPAGSFHLKTFRLQDGGLQALFAPPEAGKLSVIRNLLETYPKRRFILVGDAGERDPEIYGDIARRYPQQIRHIFIRQVLESTDEARFQQAFQELPRSHWTVFRNPEGLLLP